MSSHTGLLLRPATRFLLLSLLFTVAGCFETEVMIASDKPLTVDRRYVGEWRGESGAAVSIRNWDDREYYVELRDNDETTRMRGFIVDVGSSSFAHLRPLTDDGTVSRRFLLMKVSLADGKVTAQNLSADFFADKDIPTGEALRDLIATHVENPAMYAGNPITFTRASEDSTESATTPAME